MFDLVLRQARIVGHPGPVDIGVTGGVISAIAPSLPAGGLKWSAEGRFVCSGFSEAHIHLDKALILDRCPICQGTLKEAVTLTAAAKTTFTAEDVYRRARRVLEKAIPYGTMRMRSFVETDPRAGLRSFEALIALKRDFAEAIDLDLCAFAQEGLERDGIRLDHILS
ncbi:hypothetical protein [Consotaella aegiceratis]|uniref:hypothetical protein n=1 Tax=Consotaella aegiceratis TaxID=3097961 RepID=UPI002F40950B